ncbi:hypothetical protein V499_00077 [Pseudogymnoascus sp. VKM F-103]|nr:hypothetical protein V499_00077 [Pseudogymnoascus sp. VKM F-103]
MAPGERTASPSPKAYVKLQTPHKFFKVGRVFESDEELIYVVVREGYSSSTCCELQYVGQSSEITCSLPNIAALYLPDSPIKSPSDSQYQLKLECPRDEILPIYHFDFSKWLVLNHQIEVYKIGRVDRKSIKRLEAMFAALSTPSETITSTTVGSTELKSTRMERTEIEITEMKRTEMERNEVKRTEMESTAMERTEMEKPGVDSTEIEASTSKAAALFSTASYTNKTSSPAETSYDMTSISKRRSNNTVPTDWSGWEYNKDMGYVASRINKSGKEDPQYSGISSPPRMQTPPMESLWKDLRVALPLYENKVKGEEEISQEKGIKLAPGSHAELFKAVWTEPRGETISRQMESLSSFSRTTQSKYGELAYTSIRRFIIMASYEGHSICLPIYTYGGRGTAKSGVVPDHHAIIYSMRRRTSDRDPPRKSNGEQELVNAPIRIEPKSPRDVLHEMSRLNYAKAYTVEHNVKVAFIGRVHEDSKLTLQKDYLKIQGIPFSDNTSEPSGSNLDPNDGDNEALNGDDGTVSDIDVARANGARSESNEEVPEPELQPEPQPW